MDISYEKIAQKRRIYKRIIFIAFIIILSVTIKGQAVSLNQSKTEDKDNHIVKTKKQDQHTPTQGYIYSAIREVRPVVTQSMVAYSCDRYANNHWKRFICEGTALGTTPIDQTDFFIVRVNHQEAQAVLVQTLAGERVSHCRLYAPGTRVVDGNGYEVRMESFNNGVYTFAVNTRQPRAALHEIYFKFEHGSEVLREDDDVKVSRISLRRP